MVDCETYEYLISCCDEDGDCLVWAGPNSRNVPSYYKRDEDGKNRKKSVRKAMYLYRAKRMPKGYRVVQTCSTLLCVNPAHMKALSPSDYSKHIGKAYSSAKRSYYAINRANPNFPATLDIEKATQIRMSEKKATELAQEFGVSVRTIQDVRAYKTWNRRNMFSGLIR